MWSVRDCARSSLPTTSLSVVSAQGPVAKSADEEVAEQDPKSEWLVLGEEVLIPHPLYRSFYCKIKGFEDDGVNVFGLAPVGKRVGKYIKTVPVSYFVHYTDIDLFDKDEIFFPSARKATLL